MPETSQTDPSTFHVTDSSVVLLNLDLETHPKVDEVETNNQNSHLSILEALASDEGRSAVVASWQNELQDDSELVHIDRLYGAITNYDNEYKTADSFVRKRQVTEMAQRIQNEARRLFGSKVDRFQQLRTMINNYNRGEGIVIKGENAREIIEPFMDPSNIYIPSDGVQRFVDETRLGTKDTIFSAVMDKSDEPFIIPVTSIISASGFQDWEGRGDVTTVKKDNDDSARVIERYASLDTEAPPIDSLFAVVLPDGKVAFETENAHRVAAAILKGEEFVKFHGQISFSRMNHIPQELSTV